MTAASERTDVPYSRRLIALIGLVGLFSLLAILILSEVFGTIFFAITVAYVLLPIRQQLLHRGFGRRVAAGLGTVVAFVSAALVVAPIVYALYLRRNAFFEMVATMPQAFVVELLGMTYTIDLSTVVEAAQDVLTTITLTAARAAPVLALKFFLFTLLVYALLLKPRLPGRALKRAVPDEYHDILQALHKRLRGTLYGLYVLQGATALGTFFIALAVFMLLGYNGSFTLAVLAGILQFVPIVGPSVLIIVLAIVEILSENVAQAVLVSAVGLVFIAALPDILIRPRLSESAADLPGSLYFVGFTGGVLTMGTLGIIAGPVVVALLAETVDLLTDERINNHPHPGTDE